MKKLASLIIVFTVFSLNSFAQRANEMTIYKSDQTQIQVKGNFVYENDYIKAIQYGSKTINASNINKVILDSDVFVVKNVYDRNYLFQEIEKGILSLYKGKSNYYLENEKNGLRKIPEISSTNSHVFKSGTVSLYINNCNAAVNQLSKRASNLGLRYLKQIIATYNSCDLQENIQIADKVIEESLRKDDVVQFGLTAGYLYLNTDYGNILNVDVTSIGLITIGAKLYLSTSWLEKNRIDFNFSVDYAFSAEQEIAGDLYRLQSETSFVNAMFGVNYVLSDLNSMFKPYFGVSAGLLLDAGSEVLLSSYTQSPSLSYGGGSHIAYNLNVGTVIEVFNQELDFLIAYQPKLEIPLGANSGFGIPDEHYEISSLNFRLTYMF